MKMGRNEKISNIDVDAESKWLTFENIYCGVMAQETMQKLLPYKRESFLKRCRDWYREAVCQILNHIVVCDLVLNSFKNGTVLIQSGGELAKGLRRLIGDDSIQTIDRQW